MLVPPLLAAGGRLPFEAGQTARSIAFVVLGFWAVYSKVLYGVLLAKVCRLRSAADDHLPARKMAEGALGHRPEDEPYRGAPRSGRIRP